MKECNVHNAKDYLQVNQKSQNINFFDVIKNCLYAIADISDDVRCYNVIVEKLNEFFKRKVGKSFNFDESIRQLAINMLNEENQDILSIDNKKEHPFDECIYETIDVMENFNILKEAICNVGKNGCYDERSIKNFLTAFINCSKKMVLIERGSPFYYSTLYKKSKLLENLSGLGKIPFEDQKLADKDFYYYSIYSPYTLCTIMEIVKDIIENREKLNIDKDLREIRYEIFFNEEKRKFLRFTAYHYDIERLNKVYYDNKLGEVISVPVQSLSSMEPLNPLLLFDKIKVFICQKLENTKKELKSSLDINISIIGYVGKATNVNGVKVNVELCSLLNQITSWYNRYNNSPKLNLNIAALVNKDDIFSNEEIIESIINDNIAKIEIKKCDYYELYFSSVKIQDYLSNSDIIFIQDSSFIYVANYDVMKTKSISYYARRLLSNNLSHECMYELNDVYTRIISSDTSEIGAIVNIPRDYYLDSLFYKINLNENNDYIRNLYFSVSSNCCVTEYSVLNNRYGILKKNEIYEGNNFEVYKYSKTPEEYMEYKKDSDIDIKLSIWSLFKYVSLNYLLNNVTDIIDEYLRNYILAYENYFEIFRDIYFEFVIPKGNYNKIDIYLKYTDMFDNFLLNELKISSDEIQNIKKLLHEKSFKFFNSFFTNTIFNNNELDKNIKLAFYNALYDNVSDVNSMIFIHSYNMGIKNNDTSRYLVKFVSKYIAQNLNIDDKNNYVESFKDKTIYSLLMYNLEYHQKLNIGAVALVQRSNRVFKKSAMLYRVLSNIIKLCEDYGYDTYGNSCLCSNARNALANIK